MDISSLTGLPSYEALEKEERRRAAVCNFYEFFKQAWHIAEPSVPLVETWHLKAMCDHLQAVHEGRIQTLIINVPPGSGKSISASVLFPAWQWLSVPETRSLYASYAMDLSTRDNRRCRAVINSHWYRDLFEPKWKLIKELEDEIVNSVSGFRQAISVGSKATGLRGHQVVIDDPTNVKDMVSDAAIEACVRWYDTTLSSRFVDMRKAKTIIIMQRLHERDLCGYELARAAQIEKITGKPLAHLCLPSEYVSERACVTSLPFKDPRTVEGELLNPVMFPREVIEVAKIKLGSSYSAQHGQNPTPTDGIIFKRVEVCYWYPMGVPAPPPVQVRVEGDVVTCKQQPLPEKFDRQLQSWDLAFKKTEGSDNVVGQTWGQKDADAYLLDQVCARMDISDTIAAIVAMTHKWPHASAKLIEDKANGPAVMTMLGNKVPGLIPVEPEGGKIVRANAVTPYFRAGNVWLPHPSLYPWVQGLLSELTGFPAVIHDDQVDGLTQALNHLFAVKPFTFWIR